MQESHRDRLNRIVEQLRSKPGMAERMPEQEGAILRAALDGKDVYQIAQECRTTEGAVWETLANAARQASGRGLEQVEIGGLGSDTGFGSIGNQPPEPTPDKPRAEQGAGSDLLDDQGQRSRPSQAEGEPGRSRGAETTGGDAPPRPSQAEGELEDVEEALRRQERKG